MGTTPIFAIPYVEPTDTLATYPAADKAQALAVEAALSAYETPHTSRRKSTSQTLTANTWAAVLFEVDTALASGITYNSGTGVFTFTRAGVYQINACLLFGGTGSTQQRARLYNGANSLVEAASNSSSTSAMTLSKAWRFAAGGTTSAGAWANGAGQNITGSGVSYTVIDITLIAP